MNVKFQELSEEFRKPGDVLRYKQSIWMVQPKYDGIFLQGYLKDNEIYCQTRNYNKVILHPVYQALLAPLKQVPWLFEMEWEPFPWTPEMKSRLAGNLYNGRQMSFPVRFVIHDFYSPNNPQWTAQERYDKLQTLFQATNNQVTQTIQTNPHGSLNLTACQMLTPMQCHEFFVKGWERGKPERVFYNNEPCEGLVLINPNATYTPGRKTKWKLKPFHSVDVQITHVTNKHLEGINIKTGKPIKIYTGLRTEVLKEIQQRLPRENIIVEVEELAFNTDSSNPTLKQIRNDRCTLRNQEITGETEVSF